MLAKYIYDVIDGPTSTMKRSVAVMEAVSTIFIVPLLIAYSLRCGDFYRRQRGDAVICRVLAIALGEKGAKCRRRVVEDRFLRQKRVNVDFSDVTVIFDRVS